MTSFLASNEGPTDRVLRVILGVSLLALTIIGPKTLWGLVGFLPLITGLAGKCPLYSVFGISTCPVKRTTATQS